MTKRGRKTTGHLQAVSAVESIPRPAPPTDIAPFEAEVWVMVTNTKPADWFSSDTLPLLRSYCRHCYQASKIDQEMDKVIDQNFTDSIAEKFEKLQKMRERESAKIMALARSMRLTQQAQVDPKTAGTRSAKGKQDHSGLWDGA